VTPEEEDYEEAQRRIRKAEEAGALELDLSGWSHTHRAFSGLEALTRLPPELKRAANRRDPDE
jgi:hypothetical protein